MPLHEHDALVARLREFVLGDITPPTDLIAQLDAKGFIIDDLIFDIIETNIYETIR